MDLQPHARAFINGSDLVGHQKDFDNDDIIYLSIGNDGNELLGYFILVRVAGDTTVEFRRILIDQHRLGIGQIAIEEMENYCRDSLQASRIWLDVYEDNIKGKHIYEKLGYQYFKANDIDGRKLLFYQKIIE